MINSPLIPRPLRRKMIDALYGSDSPAALVIYSGTLWFGLLLLTLQGLGWTPWSWPTQADTAVASMPYVTCATLGLDTEDGSASSNRSQRRPPAAPRDNIENCGGDGLSAVDRQELTGVVSPLVARLRAGPGQSAPLEPGALPIGEDGAARRWVGRYICRLGGADGVSRPALAWYVNKGYGGCSDADRFIAGLPLTVWWGPILGLLVTPIVLLVLAFLLLRHSLRLPSTWRAYRRLYGSEHRVR